MSCKVLHKEGRDFMRGSLEGGVVVASDWCWSISCSTAAALTRKAGGRPLRRRRAPRSQSRKTPRSATTLPKPRRQVVVEPLLPCAKTYIRATARSSRRKASRQDYFTGTEVVAWSRASHVTTLVATRVGGKNYITKLSQTRS